MQRDGQGKKDSMRHVAQTGVAGAALRSKTAGCQTSSPKNGSLSQESTLPPATSPLPPPPPLLPSHPPPLPFSYAAAAAAAAAATQGRVGPPVGISGKARLGYRHPGQVRGSSSEIGSRRRGPLGETGVGQRRKVKLIKMRAYYCSSRRRESRCKTLAPTPCLLPVVRCGPHKPHLLRVVPNEETSKTRKNSHHCASTVPLLHCSPRPPREQARARRRRPRARRKGRAADKLWTREVVCGSGGRRL